MSIAVLYSRASFGISAPLVTVEVHLSNGLPAMSMVGLASAEVRESKERVRSAILNSGFEFPAKRIIINLGPAELPKSGGRFDLAIALGILMASDQVEMKKLENFEVIGELSLNGDIRKVNGVLAATMAAKDQNRKLLLPKLNFKEASVIGYPSIYWAENLKKTCAEPFVQVESKAEERSDLEESFQYDIEQVRGNQHAKRALLIAAVGGHNLLFSGSPGSGKTMLAKCLPGLLGDMPLSDAKEVAAIESIITNGFKNKNWRKRRFRTPHHNCSVTSITGGGRIPVPGEISLAHHGVLFLDELPEFPRSVLESLRQPLEDGELTISRAEWKVNFPAKFQLIAAMNPCPCGFFASEDRDCHCSNVRILNYLGKISGPLLDRIDLQVMVNSPKISMIDVKSANVTTSQELRKIVKQCQNVQFARQGSLNRELSVKQMLNMNPLSKEVIRLFNKAISHYHLSMRVQQKLLRVARTISDIDGIESISKEAITEAISYRSFDQLFSKARDFV